MNPSRVYEKYLKGPEDFIVRELLQPGRKFRVQGGRVTPAEGEYAMCMLEKTEQNTLDVIMEISRLLKLPLSAIGYAGLKDKHAHTYQYVTLKGVDKSALPLMMKGATLQYISQTHKPLQLGEHAGNQFTIRLHHLPRKKEVESRFRAVCIQGMPNLFGPQRFGVKGDNHLQGRDILAGKRMPKKRAKFFLHAYQAYLFNESVGDYQGRVYLLGADSPLPRNPVEERMHARARKDGVSPERFALGTLMCRGAEREARVIPRDGHIHLTEPVVLTFSLPQGSYASAVLAYILQKS